MSPYLRSCPRSITLALLLLFAAPVAAEPLWLTVFDLRLQVGDRDTVASEAPMLLLGGLLTLPREFKDWRCNANSVFESKLHVTTRYLECVSDKATVYTQVTCQTLAADNNSSTIRIQGKKGRVALFTLSCQSFISDPATVENPEP